MRTGTVKEDFEHYNPRVNARGTVKAGAAVHYVTKGEWGAWVVTHHKDAEFMHPRDFMHSYVDVKSFNVIEVV